MNRDSRFHHLIQGLIQSPTAQDLEQKMLQCLENSTSQPVTTGSNPPDTPFHTPLSSSPVDDQAQPRFFVKGQAPCNAKVPSFSYTRRPGASKDTAVSSAFAACASPEPEGPEDTHTPLAHVNSHCSVTAGWLQDSSLSTSTAEDTLVQPSSGSKPTCTYGDRADNRSQTVYSDSDLTSTGQKSAWETNPCFNQRGSWDTESGGLQDGLATGAEEGGVEGSLGSQDTPWEGSCGDDNDTLPLEQQMWQSAASADEQLQEVEKLQEQLLWYQQAVSDSNQRLAIADAGR